MKSSVLALLLGSAAGLEQFTPDKADWSTFYSKAAGLTDHSPKGIDWLDSDNWEDWDGTVYDPTKYSKQDFAKLICPTGDKVRGIKALFYQHNPFADLKTPTKAEVDNWHALAVNHVRAMVGYTADEYIIKPDRCLHLRALWNDERHRSRKWDIPKYSDIAGGTCDGSSNPHCGASFILDAEDQEPYLVDYLPEITQGKCGLRAGSEGIFSAAKSNIPWSIKWSRPFCSTLGQEGFWGGHTGPWFHRSLFGWDWWDGDKDNGNSNAILRAKWSGPSGAVLYENPDITSGRFLVNGQPPRFSPNYECNNIIWIGGADTATLCYDKVEADVRCGKRFMTYNSGGCACYAPTMQTCDTKRVSGRITFDFKPRPSNYGGFFLKAAPDWNGKRCHDIRWKYGAGDAQHCLEKIIAAKDPDCGTTYITFNANGGGCACYAPEQNTCVTKRESGRQTYILQSDAAQAFESGAATVVLIGKCIGVDCGRGSCQEADGSCACEAGWTGTMCTKAPNCAAGDGWASTAPGQTATKACPTAMTGSHSQECDANGVWTNEVRTCVASPTCSDGIQNQGEEAIDCGADCDPCDPCASVNCGEAGSCDNGGCVCTMGYTGDRCGTPPVDACATKTCGDPNGECVSGGTCRCEGGYTGANCEIPPEETCNDGLQNQDEIGIDCGGQCAACVNYLYKVGEWTECSEPCGGEGTRTRTVVCHTKTGETTAGKNCSDAGLHESVTEETCKPDACPTYAWRAGGWNPCTTTCGGGTQDRTVACHSSAGGIVEPINRTTLEMPENTCPDETMPENSQACNDNTCYEPRWVSDAWMDCDQPCGGGSQARDVKCLDVQDVETDTTTACEVLPKPGLTKTCQYDACETYLWLSCPWSECSASCGGGDGMIGTKNRDVFCQTSFGLLVDNILCDVATRPNVTSLICNPDPCTDFNWMMDGGVWGECVDGLRSRTFHCHAADGSSAEISDCEAVEPMPAVQIQCVVGSCFAEAVKGPDEPVPVDPAEPTEPTVGGASSMIPRSITVVAALFVSMLARA